MFHLPNFNLRCNIKWANAIPGPIAPYPTGWDLSNVPCNLQFAHKVAIQGPTAGAQCPIFLLLPAHTDIRDPGCYTGIFNSTLDMVEVPAGTGRMYFAWNVEDVSKGFPSEYRVAYLLKGSYISNYTPKWPIPIP